MSEPSAIKISTRGFRVFHGKENALRGITLDIPCHRILGVIGPAGSGKTTFLRALNRLNDLVPEMHVEGQMLLDGEDIYHPSFNVVSLRKRVGMLFALPVALPMSIYENVVYGPRLSGIRKRARLDEIVERSLKAAFLWDEVKDRLPMSGLRLSGGQQQRLCLARIIALKPEVILLDDPCSGLDPISTAKIEEAIINLKKEISFILVTNNTKQVARVADRTAFFLRGEMVEYNETKNLFTAPKDKRTEDYIAGRFG